MKRFARFAIVIPVAVLVVILSVANRSPVTFSLDPFNPDAPAFSVQIPLYWLIFAILAVGILVGGVATWLGQSHWRREARHRAGELSRLRPDGTVVRTTPGEAPRTRLPSTVPGSR